jgi:hypothetical protein
VVGALSRPRGVPDAIFYDMFFPDFVADQFAEIAARRVRPADERRRAAAMRTHIAEHPKGVDGIHRYEPEEYGIDPAAVRRSFAPYIEHFDLKPE